MFARVFAASLSRALSTMLVTSTNSPESSRGILTLLNYLYTVQGKVYCRHAQYSEKTIYDGALLSIYFSKNLKTVCFDISLDTAIVTD
jgi:hypothetical protein